MLDRERLLRHICDVPHDDLPRLVFADWLEEHEEAVAAARIRWWCHARKEIAAAIRADGHSDHGEVTARFDELLQVPGGAWLPRLGCCLAVRLLVESHPINWAEVLDRSMDYWSKSDTEEGAEQALWSGVAAAEMYATGALHEVDEPAAALRSWDAATYSAVEVAGSDTTRAAAAYAAVVFGTLDQLIDVPETSVDLLDSFESGLSLSVVIPQTPVFWSIASQIFAQLNATAIPTELYGDVI